MPKLKKLTHEQKRKYNTLQVQKSRARKSFPKKTITHKKDNAKIWKRNERARKKLLDEQTRAVSESETRSEKSKRLKKEARDEQKVYNKLVNYDDRMIDAANEFDKAMSNIRSYECVNCGRTFPNLALNAHNFCKPCSLDSNKFTSVNNMDPGDVPPELQDLTYIEQMLIAQIHPVVSFYKINNAQYAYRGNVINFRQDISEYAKVLPIKPSELASTILFSKETPSGFVNFRARADKIRAALVWLKRNNPYYHDIEISEENLSLIPFDGDISPDLSSITLDNQLFDDDDFDAQVDEDEEDCDFDDLHIDTRHNVNVTESNVPLLEAIDQDESVNACLNLPYPKTDIQPINEFTEVGYIARAFPVLFPRGNADLRQCRRNEVTPEQYFHFLMQYKDRRFITDPRFRFFALNSLLRWQALSCVSIYVNRMNIETLNAKMLRDMIRSDSPYLNQLMVCSSRLRSTRPYWRQRCAELLDMVEQIGTPKIFFTLSAADYQWPDLFRLISPDIDPSILTNQQRRDMMHENPDIVSFFFKERCEIFVKHILKPIFGIEDIWYRYEWQFRGSPHLHGLLWMDGLDFLENVDFSDEEILAIRDYFDDLCSAINPNMSSAEPSSSKEHPCKRRFSDVKKKDRLKDLSQLLNSIQRHTRHGSHCMRGSKHSSKKECRFKFPRDMQDESSVDNTEGYYQYAPKRNDPLLCRFNSFITQIWRANTDFSPVLSLTAVLRYIAKYASKSETASSTFLKLLEMVLASENDETNVKKILQRLIMITLGDRDYSAQEVIHLLMKWPLYHSSRRFTCLNVSDDNWRSVKRVGKGLLVGMSIFEKYQQRPTDMEDYSLYKFAKFVYTRYVTGSNGQKILRFIVRKKESVVRVFPRLKLTGDDVCDENYYKLNVVLHQPFRGKVENLLFDSITNTNYDSWRARFMSLNINVSPRLKLPRVEKEIVPHPINETQLVLPYIAMSSMQKDNERTELGERLMDRAHTWESDSMHYPDIGTINQFLATYKTQQIPANDCYSDDLDHIVLSDEQRAILHICTEQIAYIKRLQRRHNSNKPFNEIPEPTCRLVIVQGKAGSGKTTVIKRIVEMVRKAFKENAIEVAAFSGSAAINVDGKTIHSLFRIPISQRVHSSLTGQSKGRFEFAMKYINFIIIDEMSMVSAAMLDQIEKRCREAHPKSKQLFGGMMVYLFGDFEQLPPVAATSLISSNTQQRPHTKQVINGKLVLDQFSPIELIECQRQRGESSKDFRTLLDNLGEKQLTDYDFDLLTSRNIPVGPEFRNAVRLYTTKESVNLANKNSLIENNQPVALIRSENEPDIAINKEVDDEMHIGAYELTLSVGCKVILRTNLWVDGGLCNGSLGTLKAIIYRKGECPPLLPLYVLVQFEKYKGPTMAKGLFPIVPISRSWINSDHETMTRRQLPISLGHALTIHRAQGLTLDKVILNFGAKEFANGLSYVALSRVRKLTDLIIDGSFTKARFDSICKSRAHKDLQIFLQTFRARAKKFRAELNY